MEGFKLQPIVLVGGGENHYRLIQSLSEEKTKGRPVILVARNLKVLPGNYLAPILVGVINQKEAQLDLWSVCQRKGVYFLEDVCLNINREEQIVSLKNFGKLEYHLLSVETEAEPSILGIDYQKDPSIISPADPYQFIEKMEQFFLEVHKHCPREVRVVITGWHRQSIELAFSIQNNLKKSCESCDIIILDENKDKEKGFFKSSQEKMIKELKGKGIRVVHKAVIKQQQAHFLELTSGMKISYDILVPMSHWRSTDFLGKLLHLNGQKIIVQRDLTDVRDSKVFVSGNNVVFEREDFEISCLERDEIASVLLHNIYRDGLGGPPITCRDRFSINSMQLFSKGSGLSSVIANSDEKSQLKKWKQSVSQELKKLKSVTVQEGPKNELKENLQYQAQHMSRPWAGLISSTKEEVDHPYRLNSFNGFNSWGSYAQSAIKICEISILKSLSKGVLPKQLRFSLTLPDSAKHLTNHIFESTFRAIESVAQKNNVEIDGGDTFDGRHWHLNVTIGGEVYREPLQRFRAHDYLIMTRPLGFGFLWAGRLQDQFDSNWILKTMKDPLLVGFEKFMEFSERWNPSAQVLIEEWGFLYHCLQKLPAHQQLMVNFREVPRWEGIDQLINENVELPGLDTNWPRIKDDVAFSKDDVSVNNSILWDPMSQGSLVFGVPAENWKEALGDLQAMGYERAALVGCTRPKSKGNRVVLSDWSPA